MKNTAIGGGLFAHSTLRVESFKFNTVVSFHAFMMANVVLYFHIINIIYEISLNAFEGLKMTFQLKC